MTESSTIADKGDNNQLQLILYHNRSQLTSRRATECDNLHSNGTKLLGLTSSKNIESIYQQTSG